MSAPTKRQLPASGDLMQQGGGWIVPDAESAWIKGIAGVDVSSSGLSLSHRHCLRWVIADQWHRGLLIVLEAGWKKSGRKPAMAWAVALFSLTVSVPGIGAAGRPGRGQQDASQDGGMPIASSAGLSSCWVWQPATPAGTVAA